MRNKERVAEFLYRLCGFPPFFEDSNEKLFDAIKKGEYEFPSPQWDEISDYAKDLIKKLLVVDPYKRLNADGILKHPWIVGDVTPRKNLPTVSAKIKEFNARRRLKVRNIYCEEFLTFILLESSTSCPH